MGLAPYGRDIFTKLITENIIKIFDDAVLNLIWNISIFYHDKDGNKFDKLFRFQDERMKAPHKFMQILQHQSNQ